jgi:hypothetical protein
MDSQAEHERIRDRRDVARYVRIGDIAAGMNDVLQRGMLQFCAMRWPLAAGFTPPDSPWLRRRSAAQPHHALNLTRDRLK